MAAGEADRRADAVGVEERSGQVPSLKRLSISTPPDLTMMVEEALALIERPEERAMNELIRRTSTSTWLPCREAVDRVARHLGYPTESARLS
jgi:hypothetical protein